jgi:hypothetical protein
MSSNTNTNQAAKTRKPVDKVRIGSVTASIWENTNDKGTFYNVTFERRYKNAQGNWQSTHNYGENDLQDLRKAADLAHTGIVNVRRDKAQ